MFVKIKLFVFLAIAAGAVSSDYLEDKEDTFPEQDSQLSFSRKNNGDFYWCLPDKPSYLVAEYFVRVQRRPGYQVEKIQRHPKSGDDVAMQLATDPIPRFIGCIEALNQQDKNHAEAVEIISGGLGERHVKLKFTSQRGKGIDFLVRIYGYVVNL